MDRSPSKSEEYVTFSFVLGQRSPMSNNNHENDIVPIPSTSGLKRKCEEGSDGKSASRRCENSDDFDLDMVETLEPIEETNPFHQERTMLRDSILSNDIQILSSLLEKCPIINMILPDSSTPLTLAVSKYPSTKEAFEFLLNSKNIDLNKRDANDCTPLSNAMQNNNLEVIQSLLDKGAEINVINRFNHTILKAIQLRKPDMIMLILNTALARKVATTNNGLVSVMHLLKEISKKNTLDASEVDVALVRFDMPDIFKYLSLRKYQNREELIARLLKPITRRRNVLTFAVEQKARKFINYLVSLDISRDIINELDKSNDTALSLALRNQDFQLAELLLQMGAVPDIELTYNCENVLLISAIKRNDLDAVKLLTSYNASVSGEGDHIPLTLAVKHNNEEIINHLLDRGANIHATSWKGYSPLTAAVHYSKLSIAEVLINRGADIDLCDARERSPLNLAIEENKTEFVAFLIEKNANINAADARGYTPLTQAVKVNSLELIKLLCDKGSNPNIENRNGHTPLTYAAALNHEEILLYLINECPVDVNKQGWFGSTALLNVIDNKNLKLAKALILKGANVSGGDWKGRKPLVRAVETDNIPMIQLLLDNNNHIEETNISIDWLHMRNVKAYSPISKAVALNKPEIVMLLLKHNSKKANFTALIEAIECGNVPLIELLLQNGVRAMESNANGESAMQKAIEKDNLDLVNIILEHDEIKPADVFTEACAKSAFHIITHYTHDVKLNLNTVDSRGYTPLTKCIENNNSISIEYLIEKRANVNKIDGNGFTPLTRAMEVDNFDVIKLLVENGADVSLADGNGVKPLVKAVEKDDMKLIKYLINHDKRNEDEPGTTFECPVCYVHLRQTQVYSTICGHMFCKNCLITVCRRNGLCPTCRAAVSFNSIHPLFL